ncbi:MAG: SH3 domain-containing protein [Clostridia bacterium]|nr:SH3 domain-containing protein [Clostridia bacterium]
MKTSRKTRWLALLLTALTLLTLIAPGAFAAYSTGKYRITASNGVNVRQGPGTEYAKVGAISYNKVVDVIEISGSWGRTKDGGVDGWFLLDNAVYVGSSGGGTGDTKVSYKTTSSVNLRKDPNSSAERLTVIPQGAIVTVSETRDGWGKTTYGGYTGWFSLDYAKVYTGGNYKTGTYSIGYSTDLKKEPDASSATLTTLPLNTTVEVTAVSGDWGTTTYKSYTGWFNLQNAGCRSDSGDLTGDQRKDILIVAEKEIGKTDGTKYTFGRGNVAWCAYFVSWCARQAGIPTSVIKTAGYARAYSHGVPYFHAKNYLPSPGDLVYFDWPEYDGDMNHTGIVEKVTLNDAGTAVTALYTIEGNTSNSVARRSYTTGGSGTYTKLSNVSYYGVPLYETKSAKPVTDAKATVNNDEGTIKVTWSATSGASYYDVYLLPANSDLDLDQQVSHTRTSGTSLTLKPTKTGDYEIVVYARPGDASSKAASNIVKVTVDVPEASYVLTVVNGTGSGSYKAGTKVAITADKPADGKAFIGWESSDGGSFADDEEAETTFTMPKNDTTVEAKYVNIVHAEGLTLSAKKTSIAVNEKVTVEATFKPSDVTDSRLEWSSSNSKIAKVDAEGVVTGVAAGKATIKAVSLDNDKVSATIEITVTEEIVTPVVDKVDYITTAGLNLRDAPSTSGKKLTTIPQGTKITVTETDNGWGKTTYKSYTGWVSMEYLKKADDPVTPDPPTPSGGAYKTTAALRLRETPSTGGTKLATIPEGTRITIAEIKDGWGKTTYSGKTGWVSMDYVKKVDDPTEPDEPDPPTPPTPPNPSSGTYKTTSALRLRETPSTSGTKLATIPEGTRITITEIKDGWGKTTYSGKTGWVSMDYVKKVDDPTEPDEPDPPTPPTPPNPSSGTYKTTSALRLRETPSTSGTKLATIPEGTRITITEIKDGWGKTTYSGKTGWVSMDYVKKVDDPTEPDEPDPPAPPAPTGTVYITTANLNLRDSASTSGAKLTTIPQGTKITITETKNGWGKTTYSGKTGWVSMDYVKKA